MLEAKQFFQVIFEIIIIIVVIISCVHVQLCWCVICFRIGSTHVTQANLARMAHKSRSFCLSLPRAAITAVCTLFWNDSPSLICRFYMAVLQP